MRSFRSDNNAAIVPEALASLSSLHGHALGYGGDADTDRAVAALRALFGPHAHAFFVATGTAANTLAVASLVEPWQRVVCHHHAHWNEDESTAPELITGARTTTIHAPADKLTPALLERHARSSRSDVHQPAPGVLTLSNPTEFGTVYNPAEVRALCDAAHSMGYRVHIDGARFANAVAHLLKATPPVSDPADVVRVCRAITTDAGADALSFGGTKGGLALGEAVVLFPRADNADALRRAADRLPFLRKRAGHLLSKHRMITAPFAAVLESGAWVRHAAHANAMAARLDHALAELRVERPYPTQTNAVFARLPAPVEAALRSRGHEWYPFASPAGTLARLMCSFDTTTADVDALAHDLKTILAGG